MLIKAKFAFITTTTDTDRDCLISVRSYLSNELKITTFPVEGWYDCGKPETLLSTNQYLLSKRDNGREIESVVINKPVFIAEDAIIKNSVIGPYTTIASGTVIEDSIIRNSLIGSRARVYKTMLENSIIGDDSVIKGSFKRLSSGNSTEIDFY